MDLDDEGVARDRHDREAAVVLLVLVGEGAAHVALDAREIESFVIDVAGERLFVGCD